MLKDLCYWLFIELICKQIHLILPNIISRGRNSYVWDSLKGKHVVVTGATGEMGREICKLLIEKEVKVILIDTNEHKLVDLKEKLSYYFNNLNSDNFNNLNSDNFSIHPVDFSMENNFSFLDDYENIGLLINNAEIYKKPALYLEEDDETLINVNIRATTRITRRVLQRMIERQFGYILNIGSLIGEMPSPYLASYAASKAFLKIWSLSLYYEMKKFNIVIEYVDLIEFNLTKKELARRIFNTFGSTKYLLSYFPHVVMKCLLNICPDFILGRAIEWFYRKQHLEKRLEERKKRKIEALKKK